MTAGLITIPAFVNGFPVRHFFGTRDRPSPPMLAGLARTRGKAGTVVCVKQVHGTDALVVDRPIAPSATFAGGWDAIITNQPGVLITVRTADCVPVLLFSAEHHVAAAIHAGWRGTVAGIIPRTLDTLKRQFGAEPSAIRVAIGPSAGRCCYEVDRAVLDPLRQQYSYWRAVVAETRPGRALLDLHELVRRQLAMAGIDYDHVWGIPLCTICYPELFYSYRREGMVRNTMVSGIMFQASRTAGTRWSVLHHAS